MKINLVEAWNEAGRCDKASKENECIQCEDCRCVPDFLHEQEARLQSEHERAVAEEVVKVIKDIQKHHMLEDMSGIGDCSQILRNNFIYLGKISEHYTKKLEAKDGKNMSAL